MIAALSRFSLSKTNAQCDTPASKRAEPMKNTKAQAVWSGSFSSHDTVHDMPRPKAAIGSNAQTLKGNECLMANPARAKKTQQLSMPLRMT
jgi:hypothetical protein